MMLFWQANFLEPMLQGDSLLFPSKVSECVQTFMGLDITARKAIAAEALLFSKAMTPCDIYVFFQK